MPSDEARARLRVVLEAVTGLTGEDFFASLVRDLAAALEVRYAFVSECVGPRKTEVRTLAFWSGDGFAENFQYSVAGTPCAGVLAGDVCLHEDGVQHLFPSDRDLRELGAQSYLGLPILTGTGEVIGHLAVLDVVPLSPDLDRDWILKIFAARAGAELARKQAGTALRASEERFRRLAEQSSDLIAELDPAGRFAYASPNHQAILGYQPEELVGRDVAEVAAMVESSRSAELEDGFALDLGRRLRRLTRVRHRDGSWRWFETALSPYQTEQGEVAAIAVSRDVSERIRIEEHLRETQKLESLGILAGGIAHDFNNLLTPVLGNASMALERVADDSSLAELMREIESSATQATELTQQLLTYAGKAERADFRIDLSQLVRDLGHLLRAALSRKVEITFELADDLPAVDADAGQLRQVVLNLLTNASEAIGEERGRIRVATGAVELSPERLREARLGADLPAGPYVFLDVEDDGCGMASSVQEHIFEPFFTTKFAGRGLGLAALRGIVRSHEGAIQLSSRLGEGASFRVLLPVARSVTPSTQPELAPDARPASGTVLFVDDEPSIRRMVRAGLESRGFSVVTASNGAEALRRFREDPDRFVAVVLDLAMPQRDGLETLREIRTRSTELPVLLISGYGREEVIRRVGPDDRLAFLAKPFRQRALLAQLEELLGA